MIYGRDESYNQLQLISKSNQSFLVFKIFVADFTEIITILVIVYNDYIDKNDNN